MNNNALLNNFILQSSGGIPSIFPTANLETDFNPEFGCYSDDVGTLCEDDDTVYDWVEQSPYGLTARQTASGDRPLWKNTGGSVSAPYVYFEGSEWMEILSSTLRYKDDNYTAYVVMDFASNPGSYDTLFCKVTDYDWYDGWRFGGSSGYDWTSCVNEWSIDPEFGNEIENNDGTNAPMACAFRFKTDAEPYQNNNRVSTNPDDTNSSFIGFPGTDAPNINALLGASYDYDGDETAEIDARVYRILIYNKYHDDDTYAQIIDDLKTMYSV